MDRIGERLGPKPTSDEMDRATETLDRLSAGGRPSDRMEAGLVFAAVGTRDVSGIADVEDRRFAKAFARGLARCREMGGEAPSMGSQDWARVFAVDASIQRECEASLRMDVLDRADRHRWGSPSSASEPWAQAGITPDLFGRSSPSEMKAMAAGVFEDVSGVRGVELEIALLSASSPAFGASAMDRRISLAAGLGDQGGLGSNADEMTFGPAGSGPGGREMAAIADRMVLARRASEVGHRDAVGLFDPTPGRNPFAVSVDAEMKARTAVAGQDASGFGRAVAAASAALRSLDVPSDPSDPDRLRAAAARVASRGTGTAMGDARVMATDVLIQKSAAAALSDRDGRAAKALELMVSGNAEFRESVGFTGLKAERAQTELVAAGRFEMLDDSLGIASGIRNATWRAGIAGAPSVDAAIRQDLVRSERRPGPSSPARGPTAAAQAPVVPRARGVGR